MIACGGLTVLACCIFLYHHDPEQSRWGLPCVFHALTGWDCPSCGSTRALYHLLHGELAQAWAHNPFLALSWPLAAVIVWWTVRRPRWVGPRWPWILAVVYVALMIVWWIVRNLLHI